VLGSQAVQAISSYAAPVFAGYTGAATVDSGVKSYNAFQQGDYEGGVVNLGNAAMAAGFTRSAVGQALRNPPVPVRISFDRATLSSGGLGGVRAQFARRVPVPQTSITRPVGELRAAGLTDAHHVIQDAAVRNLPGYYTNAAPGVQLLGPSTARGTPHYAATQVQRLSGGGTYAAERRIGYKALRRAGYSEAEARQVIQVADDYFYGIGVRPDTPTRIPGNR